MPVPQFTIEERKVAHAAELFEVLRDKRLYEFLDESPPATVEELAARLARSESRLSPDGIEHWLNWVIRAKDGAVIGYVQATVEENKETNVAYVLAPSHHGRGIASAAVQEMLGIVASQYGANAFFIRAEAANEQSVQLARRLGFTPASQEACAARSVGPSEVLYCRRVAR
jgi:[ribosomal protein S5]-alanine N-acetyltransferase